MTDGAQLKVTNEKNNHVYYKRDVPGVTCGSGNCMPEIAKAMYENDISPVSVKSGKKSVIVHTIGFALDSLKKPGRTTAEEDKRLRDGATNLLKETAKKGGGKFYSTTTYNELLASFESVVKHEVAAAINATYTSPAISVNAFNGTTHRNELYYSLFYPKVGPHWSGNLKKFKLEFKKGTATIKDSNGNDAIDTNTGFFKDSAKSYWSTSADGGKVTKGGTAALVPAKRETVYTNINGNDLTESSNRIRTSNAVSLRNHINRSLKMDKTKKIINWMIGNDVDNIHKKGTDKPRMELGDGLHSSPVVVQYGGTEDKPDLTIFSSNNDGFLNAFNESTGEILYSFIPKELLSNIDELYANDAGTPRPYGLDGHMTTFVTDANKNGKIDGTDKAIVDHV
jgi:type IV pilus assembly protein PilY1